MNEQSDVEWKWGVLVALFISILALYPQLHLWSHLGRSWAGGYAYFDTDEAAYSAYLQALIDGRPRRSDPYVGRDDLPGKPLPESVLSIQFIPPYMAAIPARVLGLSASTVFIALMPMVAVATALTLFWLLAITTQDNRLAAVGVLVVLCLATLASGEGPLRMLFGAVPRWNYLTFLRPYVPAIAFPFWLGMFGLVWRSVRAEDGRYVVRSVGVGLIVALLILSYFYLWTAALAWLACLTIVWLLARPAGWQRLIYSVSIVGVVALSGLVPYLILLGHRAGETDQVQVLEHTRSLDLFRPSELIALILLAALARLIWLGRLAFKDPTVLFVLSLLLLPFVVFNQQIITGQSLQPFHYEEYVTSYTTLIAVVLSWQIFLRAGSLPAWTMSHRALFWIAVFAITYGANSASAISRAALDDNIVRDQSIAVARRLKELSSENEGMVFSPDPRQADILPTLAPNRLLWALHMYVFSGSRPPELKERFYHYLYYSNVSPGRLGQLLAANTPNVSGVLFGAERAAPHLTKEFRPVTKSEADQEEQLYADYLNSFSRVTAARYLLAYLVVPSRSAWDSANLDRWYQRDGGEQVGDFTLYRLKLRP